MAIRKKTLPKLSLRQRVWIFGIGGIVLVGVAWSQWFMANQLAHQAPQQFYNDLPDVNLAELQPEQRTSLIRELNATECSCGCGMTIACCRNRDRKCQTSLKTCKEMVGKLLGGKQ
jgi:hypothetical protein